jgi:hypothetical protein
MCTLPFGPLELVVRFKCTLIVEDLDGLEHYAYIYIYIYNFVLIVCGDPCSIDTSMGDLGTVTPPLPPAHALVGSMGRPALNPLSNFQGASVNFLFLDYKAIARIASPSALASYDLSKANDVIST